MPKSKKDPKDPNNLFDDVNEQDNERAPKIVWETRDDIKPIVSSLIEQYSEQLHHIQPNRIAYAGFSKKKSKVLAFVKPISGVYDLFMQNDYILAVYLEDWVQKSVAEKRVLILHELLHIPDGGFEHRHKHFRKTVDHDIKDFAFVIQQFGTFWEKADNILQKTDKKEKVETVEG